MTDLDSPWKETLDEFFEPFMWLLFPQIAAEIDWSRGYESLDAELQKMFRDGEHGRRLADKLFKVFRRDGAECFVLIHIELQNQPDADFDARMFVYHYRIFDRYQCPVVSLAVLGDADANWRPGEYRTEFWGCSVQFRYPAVKLLDFAGQEDELAEDENPIGQVVAAHLLRLQTVGDPGSRREAKLRIVKALLLRGMDGETVRRLFRVIDWLLMLPEELERQFFDEVSEFERANRMTYITSVERLGYERGVKEEAVRRLRQMLPVVLRTKIGNAAVDVIRRVQETTSLEILERVADELESLDSVADIETLLDGD